jgi:hypothetical protein
MQSTVVTFRTTRTTRAGMSARCSSHAEAPENERYDRARDRCATLRAMRVIIADDHRLMLDGIRLSNRYRGL